MHSNQSSEYPLCCKKGGGKWLMHIWIKVQLKDAALSYSCYSSIRSWNTHFAEGKREEVLDESHPFFCIFLAVHVDQLWNYKIKREITWLIARMSLISVNLGRKILIGRELVKISHTTWGQFESFFSWWTIIQLFLEREIFTLLTVTFCNWSHCFILHGIYIFVGWKQLFTSLQVVHIFKTVSFLKQIFTQLFCRALCASTFQ